MNENVFSCPGFTASRNPPWKNFWGVVLRLKKCSTAAVKRVVKTKNRKPSQFSRPSIPATAPLKQEEMNLTLYIELLLNRT